MINVVGEPDPPSPSPPPPVPRLIFAENVDRVLKEKRSARERERSSEREGYQSSDTERGRRNRFGEALRSPQWSVESSDSIPSPTPLLTPTPLVSSPTSLPLSLPSLPPTPRLDPSSSSPLPGPSSPLPGPSSQILSPKVKRTPPASASYRDELPSLERIPAVVPRTHPEPEPTTDHPPEQVVPAELAQHFEQPPHPTARALAYSCLCIAAILLLPIAFVLLLTSIPLGPDCCGLRNNMVYLLVYQPLWSVVVGLMVWMWMAHQLNILHPESIGYTPKKLILFCVLVVSFAFLVPAFYAVISLISGTYPLRVAEYVIVGPLLFLIVALYFTVTDEEGRALPGFLRNFCVHLLVILLLQVYLGVMIGFIFFFPQLKDTFIQIIVAVAYQLLTSLVRWIANYTIAKFTVKSIDKYKKSGVGREYNNRSTVDLKTSSGAGVQPPSAYSTATRTQSLFLQTFLASLNINSSFSSAQAQPPPIISPDISSSSLQYFLVNLHGTSFWPVFFLTYTRNWEGFALQLLCALLIFSFYALRLTDFWFHFSAKSQSSNQRRIWIVAELTMKVDLVEYRKKVCTEFAFHFMSEAISLLAFLILLPPICGGHNADLYPLLCGEDGEGRGGKSRGKATAYAAIALGAMAAVFALSLAALSITRRRYPRTHPPLRTLFSPCLQFLQSYARLLIVIAASCLIFPYHFSLALNRMAHVP